jgi:hypothetical protein
MSNVNQTAPEIAPTPQSSDLTGVEAVTWDKVPVIDIVTIFANSGSPHPQLFSTLPNCQARLKGRAYGKISNLTITLHSDPEHAVTAAVGVVPTNAGASNAPSNIQQVLACGGVVLRATPFVSASSGSPIFMPGVSALLKGENITLLAGSPPTLYFAAAAAKIKDWSLPGYTAAIGATQASGTAVHFILKYDLELSGYDWIKPF